MQSDNSDEIQIVAPKRDPRIDAHALLLVNAKSEEAEAQREAFMEEQKALKAQETRVNMYYKIGIAGFLGLVLGFFFIKINPYTNTSLYSTILSIVNPTAVAPSSLIL